MVTSRLRACLALACLLQVSAACAGDEERVLELSIAHEPGTPLSHVAEAYLARLCAEIKMRCLLVNLPPRRSEAQLKEKTLDGEVGRIRAFAQQHPGFVLISPPFFTIRVYAFTAAGAPTIDSWDEMARQARTVSYKRGVFYFETKLEALRPTVHPHDVQDSAACLRMVLTGRDAACLIDDGHLGPDLKSLLQQGSLGRPLAELEMHIVLNARNALLAPKMEAAASRLREHGIEHQLLRDYFTPNCALPPREK